MLKMIPISESKFNHKTREWATNYRSSGTIRDSSQPKQDTAFYVDSVSQPSFTDVPFMHINYQREYPQLYEEEYYRSTMLLTMFGNSINFKTYGHLNRVNADFCAVDYDSAEPLANRVKGIWYMTNVIHTFTGDSYFNEVVATRMDTGKADV
jgi:hypothetical protein